MTKDSALVEQASAEKACADRPVQDETVSAHGLHDVLDSAQIGVWEYDLTTGCVARSLKHDQIYGYTQKLGEWTLDTLLAHVAPEHRDAIRTRFEQCRTEGVAKFDCRIIRADGSSAWI